LNSITPFWEDPNITVTAQSGQFVAEPLPMKNSTNAVVYYLFFASQKTVAQKIIDDIFKNYR
jgi:hypothetical protein